MADDVAAERLYARLFAALPTPHVAVTPDMVVVDASDAYLDLFGLRRADVVGRPIVSLFPPDPASLDVDGTPFILQSFTRAAETRRPDPMPVARYDIVDHTGEIAERYWSHVAFPVVDEARDEVALVVQVLTEVTEYVRREQAAAPTEGQWRSRAEAVEALLLARVGEVRDARAAERRAVEMRAALAETALGMAGASSVAELDRVLIERGRAAVGAVLAAVSVRDGALLRQTITAAHTPALVEFSTIPLDSGLHSAVVSREGRPVLLPDAAAMAAFSPEMADVVTGTGLQAVVGFPWRVGGELRGALSFCWDRPRAFSDADVDVLQALAAQYGQAVGRIEARRAEQERTVQAVQMSEALQRSLLSEPRSRPGTTVTARYRPAAQLAQIGGDWFDSFTTGSATTAGSPTDGELVHVVVGDVSGHDQDAAALMGQTRNVLRGIAHTVSSSPADVLGRLDRTLASLGAGVYATVVLATLTPHPDGGASLQWANAGHPAPLLLRADGTVDVLATAPEPMLGADPGRTRSDHRTRLAPGETLLLYTDGLIERRRSDLDAGQEWLVATVREHLRAGGRPHELCDHLLGLVAGHAEDDVVLLALTADR
ncbi:SpoIIE family protein phosphatase [Modestobacter sp. L9-4]|uniref:SpoIIE family protein phosphatase n=1 Tax=Modestobacter sp. L9-4 TaxID=2851567 RepID=UPI001C799277|nr:SpoIIE family protein phosphatase [Modestobacter sp. L9-4]QXG77741.1 SpoIIE family protein phosphatase [Modestobacter sp. L9-4]